MSFAQGSKKRSFQRSRRMPVVVVGRASAWLTQIEQHELTGVEVESLFEKWCVDWAAERHQLRFYARELRHRAHREKHLFRAGDGRW